MSFSPTRPFDAALHDARSFTSGEPALDVWLRCYAGQRERRDAARTFVTTEADRRVAGYYTLVATSVEHALATASTSRGIAPTFPIPAVLIARLAVDRSAQGIGLGRSLLLDALHRIERASGEVGIRAVLVHAVPPAAARFYTRYGFEPAGIDERTLMVPLGAVWATLAARSSG